MQLRFDGAMQIAEVRLNGALLTVHKGGYLPFIVSLGPMARNKPSISRRKHKS